MNEILILSEHQEIFISEKRDIKNNIISYEDRDILFNITYRDKKGNERYVVSRKARDRIKVNSIVGSISLKSGLIIEILPKFSKNNLTKDGIKKHRRMLLNILRVSNERNFISSSSQSSKVLADEMPLLNYIIELFSIELLHSLRSGIYATYTKIVENSSKIRGNILISKSIQNNLIDKSKVYTSYNKHSSNNLLMQVFRTLVKILLNDNNLSYIAKKTLHEVYLLLGNVDIIPLKKEDFQKVVFNRLNDKFDILFKQAEFIFNQYMPFTSHINSTPFWAILFDMNYLFEKFCSYLFRKSNINFAEQSMINSFKNDDYTVSAKPDYIIDNNIVVDAKWKLLDKNKTLYGLNAQNFWQLFSYMNLIADNEINGYFIVPKNSDDFDDIITFEPIQNIHKSITILSIDFSLEFDELIERYQFKVVNDKIKIIEKFNKLKIVDELEEDFNRLVNNSKNKNNFLKNLTEENFIIEYPNLSTLLMNISNDSFKHDKLFYISDFSKLSKTSIKKIFDSMRENKEIDVNLIFEFLLNTPNTKWSKNKKRQEYKNKSFNFIENKNIINKIINPIVNKINDVSLEKEKIDIEKSETNLIIDCNPDLKKYISSFTKEPNIKNEESIKIKDINKTTLKEYQTMNKNEKILFINECDFNFIKNNIIKEISKNEKDMDILEDFTYNQTLSLQYLLLTYNRNIQHKEIKRIEENIEKKDEELYKIIQLNINELKKYLEINFVNIKKEIILGYKITDISEFKVIKQKIIELETINDEDYLLAEDYFRKNEFKLALDSLENSKASVENINKLKDKIYKEIGISFNDLKHELLEVRNNLDNKHITNINKYIRNNLIISNFNNLKTLRKELNNSDIQMLSLIIKYIKIIKNRNNKFIKNIDDLFYYLQQDLVYLSDEAEKVLKPNVLSWKDIETDLIWEVKNEFNIKKTYNLKKSLDYVKEMNREKYAGSDKWRVPSIKELRTLHIKKQYNNFYIKKPLSNNILKDFYGSSTQYVINNIELDEDNLYIVNFRYANGKDKYGNIKNNFSLRCVRDK